jgi:hypothetical protein
MQLRTVEIAPSIQARPELESRAQRAVEQLEAVLGKSAPLVSARWTLVEDEKGRPLLRLEIADWTGSAHAFLMLDELDNVSHLRSRMLDLWGDLLQVRSHRQLDELRAVSMPAQDAV